jgi:hypothetical protein
MLATIAELEAMIAMEATAEPRRPTDLTALLASLVDDSADGGLPIYGAGSPTGYAVAITSSELTADLDCSMCAYRSAASSGAVRVPRRRGIQARA